MKTVLLIILSLIIFTQTATSQETIGFSNPGETFHLEDYRLPTWGYDLLYLDFDGSFSAVNTFNDTKNRNTYGRVAPSYLYYRESEELIIDARAELPLRVNRSSTETDAGAESSENQFRTNFLATGNGKYYLDELLFATGAGSLNYNTNRRTTDNQNEVFRRDADFRLQLSAGAGYGRVRNVTPVIRALRFNERLNALGAGNLDNTQIQDMSSVFAQRTGYTRVYDRANKHFWDEISNVAPEMLGTLSFYDAYYLSETLLEQTGQRYEGWDVTGMLFLDHRRFYEERETNGQTDFDDDSSQSQFGLNIAGRFFHNLSLEQMVSARANLGFGKATFSDADDSQNLFLAGIELGHLYNITDRMLVESAISNNYESIGDGDFSESDRVFRINSRVTYFIENNVSISADISYRNHKIKEDFGDFGDSDESLSDFGINISLRYIFLNTFM